MLYVPVTLDLSPSLCKSVLFNLWMDQIHGKKEDELTYRAAKERTVYCEMKGRLYAGPLAGWVVSGPEWEGFKYIQ